MPRNHCCTSRQPPSPDGEPTRVAYEALRKTLTKSPKKLYNLSPQKSLKLHRVSHRSRQNTSSWGSKYSKPEEAAEFQAIFEDKDLTETKESRIGVKKSSATLNAVKNKISKRLSRDSVLSKRSGISKRRPKLSTGTSEEELARRQELRDIRKKRIREELSNAGIYDDDAKSFASAISLSGLPEIRDDKVILLAGETPFSGFEWTPSKLTGSAIFTISGQGTQIVRPPSSPLKNKSTGRMYGLEASPIASSMRSRRHSFPKTSPESALDLLIHGDFPSFASQPEIPPTPVLEPMRMPSIVDSATRRTSWRLSFASDMRARQLRALSQYSGLIPDVPAIVNLSSPRAMKTWLRSQGLRLSSQAPGSPEPADDIDNTRSHVDLCSHDSEFGGVDGSEDNRPPVRLHEMQIHQRLASRGLRSSISTPQMSTWGSRYDIDKLPISASICRPLSSSRSRKSPDNSSLGHINLHIPGSWGNTFKDGASSFYPSSNASLSPTPEHSRSNLDHLLFSAKLKGLYIDSKASSLPQLPMELTIPNNTPITNVSATSLQLPYEYEARRLTINSTSSLIASDTSSFRDRERALSSIKTRFPELNTGAHRPSAPHTSRFKEDFAASEDTGKTSFLSVLHMPRRRADTHKSYDGHESADFSLRHQGNSYGMYRNPRYTSPSKTPLKDKSIAKISPSDCALDNTSTVWERALRMQAEERAEQVMKRLAIPEKYKKGHLLGDQLKSVSWRIKGKRHPAQIDDTNISLHKNPEHNSSQGASLMGVEGKGKSTVDTSMTEAWINEMKFRDSQAKEATEASARIVSNQGRPVFGNISPKIWAHFPSHTRSGRTGTATVSDNVRSRDFAICSVSATGEVTYHSHDRKHFHHHNPDKAHTIKHMSLPTRLGIGMRNKIYKLKAGRTILVDEVHGRKSSVSIGGELEYPELEIIRGPMEWRSRGGSSLENLEKEVAEMLIREEREHRRARNIHYGGSSWDGSNESIIDVIENKKGTEDLQISDPRFYDDCLRQFSAAREFSDSGLQSRVTKFLDPEDHVVVLDMKDKFKTWHGRHGIDTWQDVKFNERERMRSQSAEELRQSTVDFARELMARERRERERVLRAVECFDS